MNLINLLIVHFLFSMHISITECNTVFTVSDCDNHAVAAIRITIKRSSDNKEFTSVTDIDGHATFKVCASNITKIKVASIGYNKKKIETPGTNCIGNACTIKICSE